MLASAGIIGADWMVRSSKRSMGGGRMSLIRGGMTPSTSFVVSLCGLNVAPKPCSIPASRCG